MDIEQYSKVGFTLQKCICDKYGIIPNSDTAIKQFNSAFDKSFAKAFNKLIEGIFNELGSEPTQCTTKDKVDGKDVPFNFVLKDNSTLSIRTNIKGDKVAPREVGQAGFEKLNLYFGEIYGSEIKNQTDIKKLISCHIAEVMPIFLKFLFDADYIVWIYFENEQFKCEIINGDSFADLDFDKSNFSFTRDINSWIESTTLKYCGKSIAEIQVHKNRTFKFRFIMKNILPFIKSKIITTETLGITAEKTICDIYKLGYPSSFIKRSSMAIEKELEPVIKEAFVYLPKPIQHCGSDKGERGGQSKSPYDFILEGNKTLSLKTNIGKMVCPPEVGQPNSDTCYLYFKKFVNDDHIDKDNFKDMVYEHIESLLPIYLEHLFDSDYLLRIFMNQASKKYEYQIVNKNYGKSIVWEKEKFSFSKKTKEDWNESNTLYYHNVSIGEFQVHKNRNCYKFRFNFQNTMQLIQDYIKELDVSNK